MTFCDNWAIVFQNSGEIGTMYARLLNLKDFNDQSVFLFGPRGTGKTSWVKKHIPDALYFDLLDSDVYSDFLARPRRLGDFIPRGFNDWIVVDEVQKIPALLDEVHRLIESQQHKFVLTGSSARSLRRAGVNLLAGRALTFNMYPLTAEELGSDFDLQKTLQYGQLPKVKSAKDPEHFLKSYVKTYLREEVLQEGLLRDLGSFSRFLETATFSQGSVINYSEIAREVAVERKSISNYFGILEDLLLGIRLPAFTKRAKRRLIESPKFYYFDVGVYRSLRPMGPLDTNEEIDGPGFETLFLQEIQAINGYYNLDYTFYYWRTTHGTEVDFIAYGKNGLHAFEIKRKMKVTDKDLKGLRAFSKDYPMAKLHLIYGGRRKEYRDNADIIPMQDVLFMLKDILRGGPKSPVSG